MPRAGVTKVGSNAINASALPSDAASKRVMDVMSVQYAARCCFTKWKKAV